MLRSIYFFSPFLLFSLGEPVEANLVFAYLISAPFSKVLRPRPKPARLPMAVVTKFGISYIHKVLFAVGLIYDVVFVLVLVFDLD
jgi:hypothetical protein